MTMTGTSLSHIIHQKSLAVLASGPCVAMYEPDFSSNPYENCYTFQRNNYNCTHSNVTGIDVITATGAMLQYKPWNDHLFKVKRGHIIIMIARLNSHAKILGKRFFSLLCNEAL